MHVKFIHTDSAIYFGKPADVWHKDVAARHDIKEEDVRGGGMADTDAKTLSGTSSRFGPYDKTLVQTLLPDWTLNT